MSKEDHSCQNYPKHQITHLLSLFVMNDKGTIDTTTTKNHSKSLPKRIFQQSTARALLKHLVQTYTKQASERMPRYPLLM